MANERLYQFPAKSVPTTADILYVGDAANSFNEVQSTIAQIIAAYPNLSAIGMLTLGANNYIYSNNSSIITAGTITALAVSLLADSTTSAMQTTLGYTASPTASSFAGWDASSNLSANSFINGYTTTATAAALTTLTVASTYLQFFTGSTTQTVKMPVTSTLALGQQYKIVNNSSGAVTVESSGANSITVMAANTTLLLTCILTSGTTAASWNAEYIVESAITLPLALSQGGTNANLTASNGGIFYSTASAGAILAGTATAGLPLLSGSSTAPTWGAFALSLGGALTTGGAVTFSGAHAFIGTLTADTNVTFPTSGTLATTAGSLASITGDAGSATVSSGAITITGGATGLTTSGSSATLTLTGTLVTGYGGTGVTSVTTVPAATAFAGWDANKNLSANNFLPAYTTTATAASTTTLTVGSTYAQFFTGTTTQTVLMPVTSTLYDGFPFYIVNNSTGNVTIQSSGANNIQVMAAGTTAYLTCVNTGVTTAAGWNCEYAFNGGEGSGTVNSGTQYDLAYYATTGTAVSALATANSGVLVTNSSGVPSISSTLPAFITSSITFSPTTGGIVGTTTNDNAAAGKVGEFVSSIIPVASAVTFTANSNTNVTSISLTAGDWDVYGYVYIGTQTAAGTALIGWVNTTNGGSPPDPSLYGSIQLAVGSLGNGCGIMTPLTRISIASPTTVYLNTYYASASNSTGGGSIQARRVR